MLRKVTLELARCPEFPEGSAAHGYEMSLPLAKDATLDQALWHKHRTECGFRRFWSGEDDAQGHLAHRGRGWALVFDDGSGDAEVILKPDTHRFVNGEYVSIKERDGVTRTFHIAAIA
jgi:hypothetical protein